MLPFRPCGLISQGKYLETEEVSLKTLPVFLVVQESCFVHTYVVIDNPLCGLKKFRRYD